jgi:hypothetical protein
MLMLLGCEMTFGHGQACYADAVCTLSPLAHPRLVACSVRRRKRSTLEKITVLRMSLVARACTCVIVVWRGLDLPETEQFCIVACCAIYLAMCRHALLWGIVDARPNAGIVFFLPRVLP